MSLNTQNAFRFLRQRNSLSDYETRKIVNDSIVDK